MTITTILFALLGLVLLIASLIVKPIAIRAICLIGGMAFTIWLTNIFGSIPGLYEKDHRKVENQYHRQIFIELDRMLAEGHTNEAKDLIKAYLEKTEDSSFMRNPLHEIVQSLRKNTAQVQERSATE
jgi:hypothetical protein